MERSEILTAMAELKLYGMKAAFDEIIGTAVKRQHEPTRIVGDLLTAEISEKQARSIRYQIATAKLPLAKDVDDFAFDGTPINQTLVRDLACGNFVDRSLRSWGSSASTLLGAWTNLSQCRTTASKTKAREAGGGVVVSCCNAPAVFCRVGVIRHTLEHHVPQASRRPPPKLAVDRVPAAQLIRQIPPGRAGAGDPEDRIHHPARVRRRATPQRTASFTNRAKNAHSSSLKRLQITADLSLKISFESHSTALGKFPSRALSTRPRTHRQT